MKRNISEAVAHVTDSVAESLPLHFDKEALIQHLIKAVAEEVQAWYMYIAPAKFVTGLMSPDVAELFVKNGEDELNDHYDKLLKRLEQLGADVSPIMDLYNLQNLTPNKFITPQKPYDVIALLKDNIQAEQQAIATYTAIIQETEGQDYVTCDIAKEILADEVEHLTDLESLLADLDSTGR